MTPKFAIKTNFQFMILWQRRSDLQARCPADRDVLECQ
jgi:hypothetical protein